MIKSTQCDPGLLDVISRTTSAVQITEAPVDDSAAARAHVSGLLHNYHAHNLIAAGYEAIGDKAEADRHFQLGSGFHGEAHAHASEYAGRGLDCDFSTLKTQLRGETHRKIIGSL